MDVVKVRIQTILKTLQRLDDDVVLVLATMDHQMEDGTDCLLANACYVAQGSQEKWYYIPSLASTLFGGHEFEWATIYFSSGGTPQELLEEAFALRLDEAVGNFGNG